MVALRLFVVTLLMSAAGMGYLCSENDSLWQVVVLVVAVFASGTAILIGSKTVSVTFALLHNKTIIVFYIIFFLHCRQTKQNTIVISTHSVGLHLKLSQVCTNVIHEVNSHQGEQNYHGTAT